MSDPRSTYRIQFRPEFGFDDAAAIVDYLRDLGVTHLYASPYLQAASGSTHGYDVVDHRRVNDELGGPSAHERMCKALAGAGLGQILDIVPNHMAIPGKQNHWWWDVLKKGRSSAFADHFDIDWNPPEGKLRNVVLLPVLGDHYGRVLEKGELQLREDDGEVVVAYYDNTFPVDPDTLPTDRPIDALNADVDALDALLQRQNYRLAFWRVGADELDYRRFFDINTLVALRSEREEVFEATHGLVLDWLEQGVLDGVRIDHIDGLKDPVGYLRRLRERAGQKYVVVEKILEPGERVPASWPISGTTGYDAMYRVSGLFVDPSGETPITEFYGRFTGETRDWHELVHQGKEYVVRNVLGSDVERLTNTLVAVCEQQRRFRDYTRQQLRDALAGLLVAFPVYRTYVVPDADQVTQADEVAIESAVREATARCVDVDPELFGFLRDVLTLRVPGDEAAAFAARFQQVSGPVMAKGVEDTAFYRYNRLIMLNEVGGDPGHFAVRPDDFHEAAAEAQKSWPLTMNASTTHDTKRSEDVRYRVALLSEIPQRWAEVVEEWASINERHRRPVDPTDTDGERWPDRNTEYLLYETLVGAYPLEADRAVAYMEKATKEAKVFTSWTDANPAYDDALRSFVRAVCADVDFLASLERFVTPLVTPGRVTSLAATTLKLTAPGVPDIYQGTELWDLSLVDPDNRRPVDYDLRRSLLAALDGMAVENVMARADEGLPKLHLVRQLLHLRGRRSECFDERGGYEPLWAFGEKAGHVVAYRRGAIVVVVPRLALSIERGCMGTTLDVGEGPWTNVLTGEHVDGGIVDVDALWRRFPVCVLERT